MMPCPEFIQAPTLQQVVSVYTLVRLGRKLVANGGTISPEDAVEFRARMNTVSELFELPCNETNDNKDEQAYERDLDVLREVLKS